MEQSHCPTSENLQLGRLIADALSEIERLGYSRRSRNRYRAIWEHLITFSRWKELGDEFSADLAVRFLEEYEPNSESTHASTHKRNAPVAERNLARHDPRLPRPRGRKNDSDICAGKSGDETKRA
jgi:hypothetical protein